MFDGGAEREPVFCYSYRRSLHVVLSLVCFIVPLRSPPVALGQHHRCSSCYYFCVVFFFFVCVCVFVFV
jgi:hypothetical protein